MRFFDSLTHVTAEGEWLDQNRYDAGLPRLLAELQNVPGARACLVGIAGYHDNDFLERVWRQHSALFVPIAGFDPAAHGPEADLKGLLSELRDRGFAGIKLHPRLNGYDPLDERSIRTMQMAGELGLVVFLDTLFRQTGRPMRHPVDIIDVIAKACTETRIVLLHGAGSHLLGLFELGRMHAHLTIDISFTLMRYAGSSIDLDIGFMSKALDQRLCVGSDFPEYTPRESLRQFERVSADLPEEKQRNVLFENLDRLFEPWSQRTL